MEFNIFISTTILLSVLSVFDTAISEKGVLPCDPKIYGSSIVCVCNSTYCDTVEPDTVLPHGQFAVYVTSKSGHRFMKSVLFGNKLTAATADDSDPTETVTLNIYVNQTRQTIVGFGGTFTDAAGMNIASLPDAAQKELIDAYFGPDGIEYTLGRIPIASNDMSTDIYSYDFTTYDIHLTKFTIAGFDHLYKLPFIDKAMIASRRNVSLFASPWSSPSWMKTNNDMVGWGIVAKDMAKVYANYLGRFLQEYESFMFHGRMWGITSQSGPARSCDNTSTTQLVYQSMCWTAEQMRDWVVHDLKPSLQAYGYGHVKLLIMDDNRDEIPHWAEVFNDTDARNSIDGFAIQSHHDNDTNPSLLSNAHSQYPDKLMIGSEFCLHRSPAVDLGNWERAETLARSIFQDLQNYVSGFTHYNLAVNTSGGPSWINNNADGPIIVDAAKKVFYKQPMFYIMGHFSKFIPPGSTAIDLKSDGPVALATHAVAFLRPDGSVAVIMANMSDRKMPVKLIDGDYMVNYSLEPSSIQTFIWWRE